MRRKGSPRPPSAETSPKTDRCQEAAPVAGSDNAFRPRAGTTPDGVIRQSEEPAAGAAVAFTAPVWRDSNGPTSPLVVVARGNHKSLAVILCPERVQGSRRSLKWITRRSPRTINDLREQTHVFVVIGDLDSVPDPPSKAHLDKPQGWPKKSQRSKAPRVEPPAEPAFSLNAPVPATRPYGAERSDSSLKEPFSRPDPCVVASAHAREVFHSARRRGQRSALSQPWGARMRRMA